MRIVKVYLNSYRSAEHHEFEVGPFTVLFGKNNAAKTNLLDAPAGRGDCVGVAVEARTRLR